MNTPHNGNGSTARHTPDGDEFPLSALFAAIHRDPDKVLDLVRALDRLLSEAGEQPFTPCEDPCPLCHPTLWPADSY